MALTTILTELIDLASKFVDAVSPGGKFLIDLIRYTAWPAVTLTILWHFKDSIIELSKRPFELKRGDNSVMFNQQNQLELTVESEDVDVPPTDESAGSADPEKDIETIKTLATQLHFQRIYSIIFGSQLEYLQSLYAEAINPSVSPQPLNTFYSSYISLSDLPPISLTIWLEYLFRMDLVAFEITTNENVITDKGKRLLDYLAKIYPGGYSRNY